jgi:hypothetical protein
MSAKIRESIGSELMVGAVLVMLGAAAMVGELNAAMAGIIVKLWPTGLIGLGVALCVRRS